MATHQETETEIGLTWILLFLLLTLGIGAASVLFVGGDLIASAILPV